MSAVDVTLAGRAAAEALMDDACTIELPATGQRVMDPVTLAYPAAAAQPPLYTGMCRVKPSGRLNSDSVVQAGQQPISLWPYMVSVPMGVLGVVVDAIVTITASALDPNLVGLRLRVRDVASGTHVTARRLGCEVNAG